ncbi:hypothetical protein [Streptomyces sp. NPDC079189]|uniref:hypothetical protein n=1 Tax=Streptomyces sp. NPDC079189 TaxID=3154514 RepID=UPI0034277305
MRTHAIATITAGLLLATLTGCSSDSKADPAACKTAMSKAFDDTIAAGNKSKKSERAAACDGVEDETVQRIAAELISERAGKAAEDTLESAAPEATTVKLSDECRAWIEDALLDTSGDIDATAGYGVCGDMSQEELAQAAEDVTADLIKQGATPTP